ncbi:MAG: Flp pilus assembly protein CpaB [Pseudomonadota bacterium]
MRVIFILVLFVGIMLAGTAVYFVQQRFVAYEQAIVTLRDRSEQPVQTVQAIETTPILLANRDLRYGDILTENDLNIIDWPSNALPGNAFQTTEALFGDGQTRRIVLRRMDANEPITTRKISGFGLEPGMASRLSAGFRAFTINVDVSSGVSGFLSPGDRVDVFWTGRDGRATVTRIIIDNIELIAVDQTAVEDRNRTNIARTVTVEATPEQAAILAQAQSTGQLSLSLRGIADLEGTGSVEVNQNDIVGRQPVVQAPVAAPAPEPEPRRVITIRRGAQSSTVEVE